MNLVWYPWSLYCLFTQNVVKTSRAAEQLAVQNEYERFPRLMRAQQYHVVNHEMKTAAVKPKKQ